MQVKVRSLLSRSNIPAGRPIRGGQPGSTLSSTVLDSDVCVAYQHCAAIWKTVNSTTLSEL
jgi:hypothetical protein